MQSIFKAVIAIEGGNQIFAADAIAHKGKIWIVPQWLENPTEGWKIPERIVYIASLQHQDLRGKGFPADFAVNEPIPRSVLYDHDQLPAYSKYVVENRPNIRFPIPRGIH